MAADAADRHFRWSRRALKCRIQNVPEVVPSMPDFYSGLLSVYLPPLGRFLIPVHWLADRAIAQLLWARAPPTLPGPALASRHANLAKPPGSVITHRVYYCCGRHRPAVNIRSPDTTPDGSCRRCLVQCRVEPRRLPGPPATPRVVRCFCSDPPERSWADSHPHLVAICILFRSVLTKAPCMASIRRLWLAAKGRRTRCPSPCSPQPDQTID